MGLSSERRGTLPQPNPPSTKLISGQALENSITEFHCDKEANIPFAAWFARYEGLFKDEFGEQTDSWKVRLLLRKIGPSEHEKYINYILPKQPRDYSLVETVETLKFLVNAPMLLFNARFNCFNITKCDTEDFRTYSGLVNKQCERFKISTITDEQFKCLIFACRLRSASNRDVHTRILSKIEQNPDITLQQVTEECRRLVNLKQDSDMVQ